MGFHNILSKTDRALAAFVIAQGAGTSADVYPAKRDDGKTLPCTICVSERFSESPAYTGIFIVDAEVHVRTAASVDEGQTLDQVLSASEIRVQQTFDLFHLDLTDQSGEQLAQDITAAAQGASDPDLLYWSAMDVKVVSGDRGQDESGNAWIDSIRLQILCCPSNVL